MADLNNNSKCSGPAGMMKVGAPGAQNVAVTRGDKQNAGASGTKAIDRQVQVKMGGSKGSRGSTGPTNSPKGTNNLKK